MTHNLNMHFQKHLIVDVVLLEAYSLKSKLYCRLKGRSVSIKEKRGYMELLLSVSFQPT